MSDANRAPSELPTWFSWLIALAAMTVIALSVAAHGSNTLPGDVAIARLVQRAPGAVARPLAEAGNALGSAWFLAPASVFVSGALLMRRRPRDAAVFALIMLAHLGNGVLKTLLDSPRPSALQIHVADHASGFGFPSGHAMGAAQFCGGLWLVLDPRLPAGGVRAVFRVALIAFALLVGFARVYVGVHWPSDVVGGWLFGLLTIWLVARVRARWPRFLREIAHGASA